MTAPGILMGLQGDISLRDRSLDLKAEVSLTNQAANAGPMIAFDVNGSWDDVAVKPEARSLIERSGAAKPLFGPRLPQSGRPRQQPLSERLRLSAAATACSGASPRRPRE